jgi:hypothetical protein
MPVIPNNAGAEIGRIMVTGKPGENFLEEPISTE